MTEGPVRLGIVGHGVQGGSYARAIHAGEVEGMVLGAVCDRNESKREAAHGYGVPYFADHEAMIASGAVDAVVATVPHFQHPEVVIAALEAGLHALAEKPAGVYAAQVRQMNDVAAAHPDLTYAIMFNQRTNPLYRRIKEIVDGGEIGAIRRSSWIITTWYRPQVYYEQSAWRATWGGEGGGVLVNQSPHQLDLWQWICGMPKTVTAKLGFGFRREIAVEDEATILADYGDGVTGTFITATHDLIGTDRFEILGDRGKIVVEGSARATVTRLDKDEQEISAAVPLEDVFRVVSGGSQLYESTSETLEFASQWGGQHMEVLRNFAANIRHGEPLIAPGSDGINGVKLANAAHLSAWLGREVAVDGEDESYLRELNSRIRAEGQFPERS
ncbi:Gfo/Idh/MocA family protein [Pseudactinotalea terrae]|uniref:Gfo/Idh/MocA family protein n=1 Tax=Pseudactinotalea terrae TaxID=1743262 RepID=UPI0012E17F4C|nr:Gfo/Idh/MocA family oxidoreductase [Pseudactinotalea terrae]